MTGNNIPKPCPLCGTTQQRFTCEIVATKCWHHPYNLFPGRDMFLFKVQCQCGLSFEREEESVEDFIELWNRRDGEQHD